MTSFIAPARRCMMRQAKGEGIAMPADDLSAVRKAGRPQSGS